MATPFQIEAWSEYAVGLLILFLRILYRCRLVGRKWNGDDYFAVISVLFWTGELVMLELIGQYGSITGMNDELALRLSDEQVRRIVIGSKCLVAGWCIYVTLIWCLKACMLFLYYRLTLNLQQQRLVKITAVACVLAYVSTIVVILTRCLPFEKNWQVYPYPGDACALNIPNYLALVVTNITTDLMILYIPLPLLWTVQIPLRRKVLYALWLCTGVFIIIATLLRCILCLGDVASINLGTIWSIRETFVGIIAVNIPVLTPIVSAVTSFLGSITTRKSSDRDNKRSSRFSNSGGGESHNHQLSRLERREKKNRIRRGMGWTTIDNGSEEKMVGSGADAEHPLRLTPDARSNDAFVSAGSEACQVQEAGIQVKNTFEISSLA